MRRAFLDYIILVWSPCVAHTVQIAACKSRAEVKLVSGRQESVFSFQTSHCQDSPLLFVGALSLLGHCLPLLQLGCLFFSDFSLIVLMEFLVGV